MTKFQQQLFKFQISFVKNDKILTTIIGNCVKILAFFSPYYFMGKIFKFLTIFFKSFWSKMTKFWHVLKNVSKF